MTAYAVFGGSGTTPSISLVATTRTLRIVKVEAVLSSASVNITPYHISGAGHSGGSVLTPAPLRTSLVAPPATATARANSSITGTATQIGYEFAYDPAGGGQVFRLQWEPTVDRLIAPGFGFRVVGATSTTQILFVHFEELQLDWSV